MPNSLVMLSMVAPSFMKKEGIEWEFHSPSIMLDTIYHRIAMKNKPIVSLKKITFVLTFEVTFLTQVLCLISIV